METIFMNLENNEASKPHKFVLNLSQRLNLRSSNIHIPLQNLSIYYKWRFIRQQLKNNKLTIIELPELPDGSYSVSDIQHHNEKIIKNMKRYQLILLFIFTSIRLIID